MRALVEANNLLSLFTGSYNDSAGMKDRVKRGYDGEFTEHVTQYDELGYHLQLRSANIQLEGLSFEKMSILDVGCGTGALAQIALELGAHAAVCGDISTFMLQAAKGKGLTYTYCQLDAEDLPYADNSFDAVLSGMTFGLLPDQKRVTQEMIRVTKPGGLVSIGAHGPEHYWEAIDATLRCIKKRYVLGYRFEWWPRTEKFIRNFLEQAQLEGVHSKRSVWRNQFTDGGAAYDFFAAISASWWYVKYPPAEREISSARTREYFLRRKIDVVTDDIVVAYGRKPAAD